MTLLAIVLLALSVGVLVAMAPVDSRGARALVTARNLVLCLFGIYYVFPAFLIYSNHSRFTWAPAYSSPQLFAQVVGIVGLAVASFAFGHRLSRSRWSAVEPGRSASRSTGEADTVRGRTLAIGLIVVGIVLKLYVIRATGGVDDTLLRLSGYARESTGVEALQSSSLMLRTLSGVAEAGAVWLLVESMRTRRALRYPALIVVSVLALTYLSSGKRLTLLLPILAVFIGIHWFRRPITVAATPLALVGAFGMGMATLMFRIFVPANVAGYQVRIDDVSYAKGSLLNFYAYSLEFSTLDMTAVSVRSAEHVRGMFGGALNAFVTTSVDPFLYVIPRAIFPWKPEGFYDVSYGISATLVGNDYTTAQAGYASTIVGTSNVFGGLAGVVIGLFLLGVVAERVDRLTVSGEWSTGRVMSYAIALNVLFHLFRQGTLGWVFIIGVVQQLGLIVGVVLLVISSRVVEDKPSSPSRARRMAR